MARVGIETRSAYKWVVLGLLALAVIVVNGGTLIFAGMAGFLMVPLEAGGQYGFTAQEFTMLNSCPYLAGFLFCLAAGTWADRHGIKRVMIAGLALSLVGAVARVFTVDFAGMFATSAVYGVGLAVLNANVAKVLRLWFPRNMMGLAMGVYLASATVGVAVFVPVASMFSSAQPTFIIVAALSALNLVAWAVLYRKSPDEKPVFEPVMRQLGVVAKSRNLWIACLIIGLVMAAGALNNGNLVAWLSGAKGIDVTTAALAASVCNVSCSVGGILFPALIARVHHEKAFIVGLATLSAVGAAGYYWGLSGIACVAGVAAVTVLVGGYLPLAKAVPAQLPDIDKAHLGAAGGLHATVQNLFAFAIPSFIVGPLITAADGSMNYDMLQICYIGMVVLVALLALCLPKLSVQEEPSAQPSLNARPVTTEAAGIA